MDIIKGAFNDITPTPLPVQEGIAGLDDLRKTAALQVGFGSRAFHMDQDGQWMGGETFADAVYSVDMNGNVTANSITLATFTAVTSSSTLNQGFTSSLSDVTGSSFDLVLERAQIVRFDVTALGYVLQSSGAGDYSGEGSLFLYIDGSSAGQPLIIRFSNIGGDSAGETLATAPLHYIASLSAGTHPIKLRAQCNQTTGTTEFNLTRYTFSCVTLGNPS